MLIQERTKISTLGSYSFWSELSRSDPLFASSSLSLALQNKRLQILTSMGAWLGLVSPCRYKNKECKIRPCRARFVFGLTLWSFLVSHHCVVFQTTIMRKQLKLISMDAWLGLVSPCSYKNAEREILSSRVPFDFNRYAPTRCSLSLDWCPRFRMELYNKYWQAWAHR